MPHREHRWRGQIRVVSALPPLQRLRIDRVLLSADESQRFPLPGHHTLGEVRRFFGQVRWIWPGWLPAGHVTLLVGPQGVGKSYLAAYLTAVLTGAQGRWPDGRLLTCERQGAVILVDTEEFRGEYAARLRKMGAPNGRVYLPSDDVTYVPVLPNDLARIQQLAQATDAVMILVDSLSGGHNQDEDSADMRHVLKSLVRLASGLQIPVLCVHHTRKQHHLEPAKVTLDRVRGSSTITQFCRSVVVLYRPNGQGDGPVCVESLKNSFGPSPDPFGFTVTDEGLDFGAPPEGVSPPKSALELAVDFLRRALADGPKPLGIILPQAEANGISRSTLYRARRYLRIHSEEGEWTLPDAEA